MMIGLTTCNADGMALAGFQIQSENQQRQRPASLICPAWQRVLTAYRSDAVLLPGLQILVDEVDVVGPLLLTGGSVGPATLCRSQTQNPSATSPRTGSGKTYGIDVAGL